MDEHGAILLESLIRLDYEKRSHCGGGYHRVLIYMGNDHNGHGICVYCRRPIRFVQGSNFARWIGYVFLIQEWP